MDICTPQSSSAVRLTASLRLGWNRTILRQQVRCSGIDAVPLCVPIIDSLGDARLDTCTTALELAKHNITVNCYAPGIVVTQMGQSYLCISSIGISDMIPYQRMTWVPVSQYVHYPR